MQALRLIHKLRSRLEREIADCPICAELQNVDRVLGIYEAIVIQRGLENVQMGAHVEAAFEDLIAAARRPFGPHDPLRRDARAAIPVRRADLPTSQSLRSQ